MNADKTPAGENKAAIAESDDVASELYLEERPRPKDTSKRVNLTPHERQLREEEEILIL